MLEDLHALHGAGGGAETTGLPPFTQSPDAVNEITSFGRWVREGDVIRLNFESVGKQAAPSPMTFRLERRTLIPIAWNHNLSRSC